MSISEVMEPIELKYVFSAETDILTALESVSKFVQNVYFVNKGNKIIGYFFFEDLLGNHLSLGLLSLVLDFEKICYKICILNPEENFNKLPKNTRDNIMDKYLRRGYLIREDGLPYYIKTMELASLREKMLILSLDIDLISHVPAFNDQKFNKKTNKLRNFIVHPDPSISLSSILTKKELWNYIVKLESIIREFKRHFKEMEKVDRL